MLLAVTALAVTAGCAKSDRPPLGRVAGTVTLDGQPLAAAVVAFTPEGSGRTALGTTDAAGHYSLAYLRDIAGANVGRHVVRIMTASEESGGRERLPARYHRQSELVADVQTGDNTIDFQLRAK
jgi:hypothetical protein